MKKHAGFELCDLLFFSLSAEKATLTNVGEWSFESLLISISGIASLLTLLIVEFETARPPEQKTNSRLKALIALLGVNTLLWAITRPFAAFSNGVPFAIATVNFSSASINCLVALAQFIPRLHSRPKAQTVVQIFTETSTRLCSIYRSVFKVLLFNFVGLDPSVRIYLFKVTMEITSAFNYFFASFDLLRIRRMRIATSELESEFECSICLEGIAEAVLTKCGHVFHFVCLDMLLRNTTSRKCPYCGQPLEFLDPHRSAGNSLRARVRKFGISLPSLLCFLQEKSRFFLPPPPKPVRFLH